MAFLSFIFLQCDWLVLKKTLKSCWLFCFTVSFSLAEKKMRFRAKNSAIWELVCVAGGSGCARETFCGEAANSLTGFAREGIFASGKAARRIPACLISYPFWLLPTFIAFDDVIKLTNHRKGDVIQTNQLLFAARVGISRNHHKAHITTN